MAYIALIRGAVGVQYFIRQAPNSGPYAPSAWSEVRQVSLEVAEITPALAGRVNVTTLERESACLLCTCIKTIL